MWTIFKFDKKKIYTLENEIKKKLGIKFLIYIPKVLIKIKSKNRFIKKVVDILGDYLFCFYQGFKKNIVLKNLKFCRGIKHFIYSYQETQKEIVEFLSKCKQNESSEGYISNNFLELLVGSKYKFVSVPFSDSIFKLIKINNLRPSIILGHIKIKNEKNCKTLLLQIAEL